ncbi:hypothetical protein KY308_02135 [Candidatus Woesearchaeota archaeon]|nr:hypothetical protein [Candidatus Woesearchaeota archaeon]
MADYTSLALYALGFFFVLNVIYVLLKSNTSGREKKFIERLDRLAQLFTETKSLEAAIRNLVAESSTVNQYFQKIIEKVNGGVQLEIAIFETSKETNDEFFRKLCMMLITANIENGAQILYECVKNIKEQMNLYEEEESKMMLGAFLLEFVLAFVMPMIFYFMLTIVGVELTGAIIYFMAYVALCSSLLEGIVFNKWISSLLKVPVVMPIFYIAFFYLGPKIMSGFGI